MASYIEAYVELGPRIILDGAVTPRKLARRLALATGLRPSQAAHVLMELSDALLNYTREGAPMSLAGIGHFRPLVRNDGRIRITFRPEAELRRAVERLDDFEGSVSNREHIGFTPEQYKLVWDEKYPDDPMELPILSRAA